MGVDMTAIVERKENGKWIKLDVPDFYDWRNYSIYAFLAGVKNYDYCEPISQPKGYPPDSEWLNELQEPYWHSSHQETRAQEMNDGNHYAASWLTLSELLVFDYDKTFWNRRVDKPVYRTDGSVTGHDGAALAEEGEGRVLSYRDNLGPEFFNQIDRLKSLGEPEYIRIVFWFS